MADDEKEEVVLEEENAEADVTGDVFLNGEANGDAACRADEDDEEEDEDHNAFCDNVSGSVLPRRSSLMKKDAANKRPLRKKTVSFTSMDKKIATSQDCLAYMQNGSELVKVRSNSRQYHRFFSLSSDVSEIRWQPTSKKPHKARSELVLQSLVSSVKEIRQGKTTDALRNKEIAGMYPDECAFSIIFGDDFETLDLIANTPDEANIWVTGLTCLVNASTKSGWFVLVVIVCLEKKIRWLLEQFERANPDQHGLLHESEVVSLMRNINRTITTAVICQKLKELEMKRADGKRGRLNSEEFISLFKEISTRPEIYFLLVRYASNTDYLSTDDLLLFLEAEQGMQRVTKEKCLDIISQFEPSKEGRKRCQLGIDGFTAYLLSEECDLFDPEHLTVCQNMNHPLTHYFVASSHNTYLMEDQLKGPSSIEGYVRALRKGCRFVELDCWDGPNEEPVIYHGHTLTTKISFRSVIETINEYAFEVSEYPVILSIENHCSVKQQQVMAHCMTEVFGDKLYLNSVDEKQTSLPSPESLKGHILIKAKKLPAETDTNEGYVTDEDEGAEPEKKRNSKREGSVKKHKLAKELSDAVNYFVSRRFDDFHSCQQKQKYWELNSLSESQALKLAISHAEEFVNHNKRYLSRVYPNSMRVDSSNFNPLDLWTCGCQIVSVCVSQIISGQNFPKPKGSAAKGDVTDPYVTVEVFGIPSDCAEERTKTVPHNGYNPIFDESFEFQINLPELALVRIAVLDDDYIGDEFIGQYTIPFECMQTGYRHIQLLSNTGNPMPNCTLFVHVAITNKRGGGKAYRRGMSVKKIKRSRDYASMKTVGVKSIDETFRVATTPLREGADLRDGVLVALANFKEACGLSAISNIKQCIRLLSTRIANSGDHATLNYVMHGEWPYLEAQGNLPEILKKALSSFEELIQECKNIIENADIVYEKLLHCQQAGLEWHEDLDNVCQVAGLRGRKLAKAVENFAWNIRVLKGQADLLSQAKKDCIEYIRQIKEAAISTGLDKDKEIGICDPVSPAELGGENGMVDPDDVQMSQAGRS
ncbi:hypothetical protein C0Q70_05171 [Pomacea canaliculata]|uniref:Phosphoinositide phospholipase C n=1 Tax=Pomacea canaliculata TaxID=400727 RepID=A0A2T7PKF0_POMCA|nr:hypothetical protein C0Q70_05171 [Pomacea canaliculata]